MQTSGEGMLASKQLGCESQRGDPSSAGHCAHLLPVGLDSVTGTEAVPRYNLCCIRFDH